MLKLALDSLVPGPISPINPNPITDERRKRFRQELIEGKDISIYQL
jgi:hypothetical protein